MRSQARGAFFIDLEKTAPRLRQAEQTKRMPGRRGIEDDMVVGRIVAGQVAGKFVEGSDLRRAGARQLLPNLVPLLIARVRSHLGQHPRAIGIGGDGRVDIEDLQMLGAGDRDRQIAQRHVQYLVEIGCRIGADDQDRLAAVGKRQSNGASDRRFADATFAGEEHEAGRIGQKSGWMDRSGVAHDDRRKNARRRGVQQSNLMTNGTVAALNHNPEPWTFAWDWFGRGRVLEIWPVQ